MRSSINDEVISFFEEKNTWREKAVKSRSWHQRRRKICLSYKKNVTGSSRPFKKNDSLDCKKLTLFNLVNVIRWRVSALLKLIGFLHINSEAKQY